MGETLETSHSKNQSKETYTVGPWKHKAIGVLIPVKHGVLGT